MSMILDDESKLWVDIRKKLNIILIQNDIYPATPHIQTSLYPEAHAIDEINDQGLFIQISPSVVENLRELGLDGILICLYLLKYRDKFWRIKVIQKSLHIPKSTIYRNMQKLVELKYVVLHNTLEDPGKSLYQISYEGETLMLEFYDLIHLPSNYASTITKS